MGRSRARHATHPNSAQTPPAARAVMTPPTQRRERVGVRRRARVEFAEEGGRIVMRKHAADDAVARVFGTLPVSGWDTDAMMEAMRGPAELPPER